MQNIPTILSEIASTSSKNEKVALMKKHVSGNMKDVFLYAYNPHMTFGTAKVEMNDLSFNESRVIDDRWFDAMLKMFDKLAQREYTGNRARDIIRDFMSSGPEPWAKLIFNILNKDLRIGASGKSINKAYGEELIPEEFCMLASKFNEKKLNYPVYVDVKLDGIRTLAFADNSLFSRSGKEFKNYVNIQRELKLLRSASSTFDVVILDGEITSTNFQDLMRTVHRKDEGIEMGAEAIYNIFDFVDVHKDLSGRLVCLEILDSLITKLKLKYIKVVKGIIVNNDAEMMNYYNEALSAGYEGIMIKDLTSEYEYKRSTAWMKMKPEETEDLEIVDMIEGTGKHKGKLGAFVCELPNGHVQVGSGFKDKEREDYWNNRKKMIGQIVEIKFQEKTRDGSLRFPVYVRLRPDKRK